MIIGIDAGHTLNGKGTGANGYASETKKNREVFNSLVKKLKEKGHTVIDCTVDKSNNDLYDRVKKANAQKLDIFVSLHLNAFKKTISPMGVEVYTTSTSKAKEQAKKSVNLLAETIGWKNRGLKYSNYYVLKNTIAPAFLVELGFCDSRTDMDLWNTEKITNCLFYGITGKEYKETKPQTKPNDNNKMYRVVCGTYSDKKNAINRQNELKKMGINSFLVEYKK